MNAARPLVKLKAASIIRIWFPLPQSDCISSENKQQLKKKKKTQRETNHCVYHHHHHHHLTNLTQDSVLVSHLLVFWPGRKRQKHFDFLISRTLLLSIFVFLRNLIGQLEDWHFRHSSLNTLPIHLKRLTLCFNLFHLLQSGHFNNNNLTSLHPGCLTFWLILNIHPQDFKTTLF